MKITTDLIKTLNPCQDRLDNWIEHYGDKKPSLRKFTQLVNISRSDKMWVLVRLLSEENKVIFAIDMALSSLLHSHSPTSAAYATDVAVYSTPNSAVYYPEAATASAIYAADAAIFSAVDDADYCIANSIICYPAIAAAYAIHAAQATSKEQQEQLAILVYLIENQ